MKTGIIVFFFFIIGHSAYSQIDPELKGNVRSQAEMMVNAFVNENYALLLDYTYPKILTIAGGRDVLMDMVVQMMSDLKASGVTVDSAKVGEPGEIYKAGTELHALITQYIYMKIPGGRMVSESALLAVSADNGSRWYFLDIKQLTPELKQEFFPDFNKDLIIPEPKAPVITYDDK